MVDPRVPAAHGPLPSELRAVIEMLLEEASPVFALALHSPRMTELGGDGAAVVFVDTARRARFLDRAERPTVILDGNHYTIAVVPRADAMVAAAEACAHCAAQLDGCYAYLQGARTFVVHVDITDLGVLSGVLGAVEGGLH